MKTVLFLRHGKSDWDAPFDHDHERPLAKRGRKAAKTVGRYLSHIDFVPDGIISSTALRARDTVSIASKAGSWDTDIRENQTLYGATPEQLVKIIQSEPDSTERLMLVGHEPTWSETTGLLIGQANIRFPTAAVARVDCDIASWSSLRFGRGELIWFFPPKALPDLD
jgi:phosphohistidine phosphatase